MANSTDRAAVAQITQGFQVSRATAALPQTAQAALFNVVGGRVLVLGIVGEVTTVIQTQACATKLRSNPTTGTDLDICATLDITADEVGTLYGITGTFATAMVGSTAGAGVWPAQPVVLPVGTLDLSTGGSNTGAIKWDIWYLPLDAGAYVTAA